MPTIFTHAAAGAALGQWQRARPAGFWFWTLCCAILPDADVVAFAFGIPYGAMLGHRGLTHSLTFAAALGAVVAAAWDGVSTARRECHCFFTSRWSPPRTACSTP